MQHNLICEIDEKSVKSTPQEMQVNPHMLWGEIFQPITEIPDLIEQFLFA